ncbi:MAG: hypothetical protein ACYC6G_10630 [Desulfobaccales bacterium]
MASSRADFYHAVGIFQKRPTMQKFRVGYGSKTCPSFQASNLGRSGSWSKLGTFTPHDFALHFVHPAQGCPLG